MKFDYSISIIRVLAMFAIVLGHCLCYNIGTWSNRFGQPVVYGELTRALIGVVFMLALNAFVFISGLLYYRISLTHKYDDTKKFIKNKILRLLLPYLFWGLLLCLIFYGKETLSSILYGISHLWFLLMLFDVFIFVTLTRRLWFRLSMTGYIATIVLLPFAYGFLVQRHLCPEIGGILQAFAYLPLFLAGMMTEKFGLGRKLVDKRYASIAGSILCVVAIVSIGMLHVPASWLSQKLLSIVFLILIANILAGYAGMGIRNDRVRHVLLFLDHYSLAIYIIHHILIHASLYYIPGFKAAMTNHYILCPSVLFISVFFASLLLSYGISCMPGAKYIIGVEATHTQAS